MILENKIIYLLINSTYFSNLIGWFVLNIPQLQMEFKKSSCTTEFNTLNKSMIQN